MKTNRRTPTGYSPKSLADVAPLADTHGRVDVQRAASLLGRSGDGRLTLREALRAWKIRHPRSRATVRSLWLAEQAALAKLRRALDGVLL